jgi:hypothetical protein
MNQDDEMQVPLNNGHYLYQYDFDSPPPKPKSQAYDFGFCRICLHEKAAGWFNLILIQNFDP